jgi:hypothetical protein
MFWVKIPNGPEQSINQDRGQAKNEIVQIETHMGSISLPSFFETFAELRFIEYRSAAGLVTVAVLPLVSL